MTWKEVHRISIFALLKSLDSLKSFSIALILLFSLVLHGQETVEWYTWEEGMMKAEETPKKFIIDLYTSWCGWCKKMDKATFQNPVIAEYINENYIPIKFNAEQKSEIEFEGEVHKFVRRGRGYHSLAARLTNGRLSYPTVVFLEEDKSVIQALPGFINAEKFDPIMRYFADDLHKSVPWSTYLQDYNQAGDSLLKESGHSRLVNQKKGN